MNALEDYVNRLYSIQTFIPLGTHSSGVSVSSVTDLTASKPATATKILLQALAQNIRFTLDGSSPTASRGFQILAGGAPMVIVVGDSISLKVIQESATASLQYQWGY